MFERHRLRRTAQHGHAAALRQLPCLRLVAEGFEDRRRRPDKGEAAFGRGPGERGALAQEAVAGVDGVAAAIGGDTEDLFDIEISGDAGAAQRAGFVSATGMERARVVLREHGDGTQSKLGGGMHDAHGDLAAVGDEELVHARGFSHEITCNQGMPGAVIAA